MSQLAIRATLALGVAVLLLIAGTFTGGVLKFTFFPKVEGDLIQGFITMPAGTPLEETLEIVNRMEQAGRDAMAELDRTRPPGSDPLFERSVALVGVQAGGHGRSSETGSHLAHIYIQLLEGEKRNFSTSQLTQKWRRKRPAPSPKPIPLRTKAICLTRATPLNFICPRTTRNN